MVEEKHMEGSSEVILALTILIRSSLTSLMKMKYASGVLNYKLGTLDNFEHVEMCYCSLFEYFSVLIVLYFLKLFIL